MPQHLVHMHYVSVSCLVLDSTHFMLATQTCQWLQNLLALFLHPHSRLWRWKSQNAKLTTCSIRLTIMSPYDLESINQADQPPKIGAGLNENLGLNLCLNKSGVSISMTTYQWLVWSPWQHCCSHCSWWPQY